MTVRGCGRFPGLSGDETCLLKNKKFAPLSFISNMVRSWPRRTRTGLPFEKKSAALDPFMGSRWRIKRIHSS
ncbi:hypothetical protein HMPREF9550_02243 [Escherichia coli MS 187-1]|nr:hypothetical protein HMPREF9550_02243 [Escherichia coli MS 187-1]